MAAPEPYTDVVVWRVWESGSAAAPRYKLNTRFICVFLVIDVFVISRNYIAK
jgi:hypothetical protein